MTDKGPDTLDQIRFNSDRIAKALERIAKALESRPPEPPAPEDNKPKFKLLKGGA